MSDNVKNNKFHKGAPDGKHYWLTPPELHVELQNRFKFDFDPWPYQPRQQNNGRVIRMYINPSMPLEEKAEYDQKKELEALQRAVRMRKVQREIDKLKHELEQMDHEDNA